jgi:hypothetical protein
MEFATIRAVAGDVERGAFCPLLLLPVLAELPLGVRSRFSFLLGSQD